VICPPHLSQELFRRAAGIKAIALDVDGVFTDGHIIYNVEGQETKMYNAHDGHGIRMAGWAGIEMAIISARESNAIRVRATELGIPHLYLGRFDKYNAFTTLCQTLQLPEEAFCFVGDDLPDIAVFERVGLPVAVQNATLRVKDATPFHTRRNGGEGAIREVVEFVLHAQGRLESEFERHHPKH